LKAAFIDTSALVSLLFEEHGSAPVRRFFGTLDKLYASNLLEAEIRSAAAREGIDLSLVDSALSNIEWILPDRPLSQEFKAAATVGPRLRGADLWHVACALYLAGNPTSLPFVTLDNDQAKVAEKLGFKVVGINEKGH
jgi:predicted nucleic acid-binding protein